MDKTPYYITTAIAYASKMPHVGNDYEIILSDCIARYKRMSGYDVFFLTGTDDHGQKVQDLATEAGVDPKTYTDGVTGRIRENYHLLNISNDHFIRTTDPHHEAAVSAIFTRLYKQGDIYKSTYEGMYCVPCESFITPSQLVDGKCPDCGGEVKPASEDAYSFRLSTYTDRLIKHIEDNPSFIVPESRKKEMLNNFLLPGVQDLCVSRSTFTWGVPVEFDPGHVVYVWIDALSNYITALGYNPLEPHTEKYKKFWPADLHVIGKDILRFHTIYWPCMLMALGEPLPKQIFGHPWMLFGADKMSKSKGNVMYSADLAEKYGVDAVRFYALSAMPYAQDGSITPDLFIGQYNSALANSIGNLTTRTVAMTQKYFEGVIPSPAAPEELDGEISKAAADALSAYKAAMEEFRTSDAADAVIDFAHRCNKYIDQTAPWVLAKSPEQKERLGTVLYNLLEGIRHIGVMLTPVIPNAAEKMLKQIGAGEAVTFDSLNSWGALTSGNQVGEAEVLFARIEQPKAEAAAQEKPAKPEKQQKKPEPKAPETPSEIDYDAFMQTDLRVALVEECSKVEGSDKLLLLKLDIGSEKRQVVSGIAHYYQPDELIGKKVILVANLKPAKLRGILSQGMILAAGEKDVRVLFADENTNPGDRVR